MASDTTKSKLKFPIELLAFDGPLSDEIVNNDYIEAIERFKGMNGLDAIRVWMMLTMREDSSVFGNDAECFADHLGVFFELGNEDHFE